MPRKLPPFVDRNFVKGQCAENSNPNVVMVKPAEDRV
jgi:hypothetical protein